MWVGDIWKELHKDFLPYVDCKRHSHPFLNELKGGNWNIVDYDFVDCVRRKALAPFLFMECYPKPVFTLWGKSSGLLPKEGYIQDGKVDADTRSIINLVDGVAYHIALMLMVMVPVMGKCDYIQEIFHKEKRKCHDLSSCYEIGDAVKCLRNDDFYKIIRKCIPQEKFSNTVVAAVVAISCVVFNDSFESSVEVDTCNIEELNENEERLKDMGNSEFKDGDYTQAIASYTKIIKTRHYNSIIYNNRALAFMKLGKSAEAEVDGHRAVVLKPARCKGYYCFVQAMEEQSLVHEAHAVAQFGLSKCDKFDCSNWKVLKETMLRLSKKCETCASSKKTSANSNRKDSSSNNLQNGFPAQKNPRLNDVPDLVSDSESDTEREKLPSLESLHADLVREWKAGSEALLDNRFLISIRHFQKSFSFIASLKRQNDDIEEFEVVLINYSLAVAHYEIGGLEDLKKAVIFLEDILNKHKEVRFPSAYYKLGSTFFKMNRFDEALIPLTNGLSIVEKGILFTTHTWPGTDIKIEETQTDKLTDFLKELIEKCRYPPNPEAICRFESCLSAKNIFYSDPDFKGFSRVSCSESCHLEYHPHCWKLVKEKYNRKEKDFFGQTCLTPDCNSAISVIEIIDKDGLSKKFVCDATKQQEKQRKTKLEKKLEQKAKRRQKKRDDKVKVQGNVENHEEDEDDENEEDVSKNNLGTTSDSLHISDKIEPLESQESADLNREKENISPNQMNQKLYEDNAEPLYVLKRDTDDSTKFQPVESKQKQKKKAKKNVMSADEFCGDILPDAQFYNEYLSRVKKLQVDKDMVENGNENWASLCEDYQGRIPELDPQRPFYIPEDLRNNPETLESILQSYGRLNESEEDRDMRETIYTYMEDYLESKGPMLKESPELQRKIQTFRIEFQQLIAKSGGLVDFLLESFRFAAVKNYICVMRDISKAYCLPSVGGVKQESAYSLDGIDDLELPKAKKEDSPSFVNVVKKYSEAVDTLPKKDNSKIATNFVLQTNNGEDDDFNNCTFSSSTIRKLNNTINRSAPASQFQLQVLLRSLNETQQNVVLVGALNSLMEGGTSHESLQSINRRLKGIIELKHPIKCIHKISQTDKVAISTGEVDVDVILKLETFKVENKCLEERITISEDTVVRLQNQHSVKLKSLEKEINELSEQLNEQQILNITMEAEKEAELKRLQLELKHAKQEQQIAQSNKLSKQLEEVATQLQAQIKETEKAMNLLEQEKRSASNLQDTLSCMLESGEESTQRASRAEKGFLRMKRMCGLMKLDESINKSTELLNKIEEEKRRCGATPLLATVLNQHEAEGKKYLEELDLIKQEFLKSCNVQMQALKNGEQLSSLDLDLPKVHEPPSAFQSLLSSPSFAGPLLPTPHPMFNPMMHGFPPHGPMPPGMMYGPKYPPRFMSNIPPPGLNMNRPPMFPPPPRPGPGPGPGPVQNEPEFGPMFRKENPSPLPVHVPLPPDSLKSAEPFRAPSVEKMEPVKVEPVKVVPVKVERAKHENTQVLGASASASSGSLYDKLTPIPTTPYDTLCDIQLKAEQQPTETAKSNVPLGTTSWRPNTPLITEASLPLVPPSPPKATVTAFKKVIGISPKSKGRPNSYDKLISKLEMRLPKFNPGYSDKFDAYIQAYRAKNNYKLTGKSMDEIVEGVAGIIERDMMESAAKQPVAKNVGPKVNELENHKDPIGYNPIQKQGPAWEQSSAKKTLWKAEGEGEQTCCICFEEMSPSSVCKVECGHTFHSKCVKEWLKKDRTCPLCRVFILLPEEFPSLG